MTRHPLKTTTNKIKLNIKLDHGTVAPGLSFKLAYSEI